MNVLELGQKALAGYFFVVGEVRAAKAETSGYVDRKTGIAMTTVLRKYFIERRGPLGFDLVRITGKAAPGVIDPVLVPLGVEIGKIYAFAVEHIERKPGFIAARMSPSEPEPIHCDRCDGPASVAPQGAADAGAS